MKNLKVHSFENGIYQPRLYVVVDNRLEEITKTFKECDDSPLKVDDINDFTRAFVYNVPVLYEGDKEQGGFLIVFNSKKVMDIPTIAHECFHAVCGYADLIGIDYEENGSNEARAYLLGWMVKCCMEVKNFKDNGDERALQNGN